VYRRFYLCVSSAISVMARVLFAACALLCACAFLTVEGAKDQPPYPFPPGFPYAIPTAIIDLDMPPAQRWVALATYVVQTHGWEYSYENVMRYWDWQVPAIVRPIVEWITEHAEDVLIAEYVAEIKGAFNALAPYAPEKAKFTLSKLMAMNLMYEFSSACTSVVAADAQGSIWHGRNLDWGTPNGVDFSNFTYLISFQRGGKEIYRGVNFVGYVGSLTVMRPGAFAITIDERTVPPVWNILDNIARMETGLPPVTWMARLVAQNNESFADALTALTFTDLAAPAYYIISGRTNEGCVLARDWNETAHGPWCIPDGPKPWYVLETNYDHWLPAPGNDNRRATAEGALAAVTQSGMGATGMYSVMTTAEGVNGSRGVLNTYTRYSVVMQPSTGHFGAWNMN
jgi:hypothetical protein